MRNRIISDHRIEVHAAFFFDGVAADPSAEFGAVVAVVVIDETGFVVVVFAAEAERVDFGQFAGRGEEPTERVVDVFRGFRSRRVNQRHHVLVAIRDIVVGLAVIRHRKRRVKPGRFRVPDKGHGHCVIVQRVQHLNQLVAVIDEFFMFRQYVRGVDLLLEAAPHVVVVELKPRVAVLRRNQAVFTVPAVAPAACAAQLAAVRIIGEFRLNAGFPRILHFGYLRILVHHIRRINHIISTHPHLHQTIPDHIIGVAAEIDARRAAFKFPGFTPTVEGQLTLIVVRVLHIALRIMAVLPDTLVPVIQVITAFTHTVQFDLRQTVLRVVFERPRRRGLRRREAGKLIQAGAVGVGRRPLLPAEHRGLAVRVTHGRRVIPGRNSGTPALRVVGAAVFTWLHAGNGCSCGFHSGPASEGWRSAPKK